MVGYKFNYVSTYNGLINVVGLMYNPIFLALLNIKSEKAYKLCRQNLNKWIGSLVVNQTAFCIKIFMMSCVKNIYKKYLIIYNSIINYRQRKGVLF